MFHLVACVFAIVLVQTCNAAITLEHVSSILLPSSFIDAANKDSFLASLEAPYSVEGDTAAGVIMTTVTEADTPEYFEDHPDKIAVSQMLKGGAEQTAWHAGLKLIVSVGEGGIVTIVGVLNLCYTF